MFSLWEGVGGMNVNILFLIVILSVPFTAIGTVILSGASDDLQKQIYIPDFDLMTCDEIGKWLVEKRHDGNGFEQYGAKKEADLYPVKCGVNGSHLDFEKPEYLKYQSPPLDISIKIYDLEKLK